MKKCIFLDRDGTIIVEKNYLSDPRDVELLPGAAQGLGQLAAMGYLLVVVTNQSGVGRSYFDVAQVEAVHARLDQILEQAGARIDKYFYCPHLPDDGCRCRKPSTGMIDDAVQELGIDIRGSYMIGDKLCDLQLGKNSGLEPVLVRTGYGANLDSVKSLAEAGCRFVADNLLDAAGLIENIK
jgi:D-glycero-D-manno-heptose 1,7-bisphosphate phosphatase